MNCTRAATTRRNILRICIPCQKQSRTSKWTRRSRNLPNRPDLKLAFSGAEAWSRYRTVTVTVFINRLGIPQTAKIGVTHLGVVEERGKSVPTANVERTLESSDHDAASGAFVGGVWRAEGGERRAEGGVGILSVMALFQKFASSFKARSPQSDGIVSEL